MTTVSKITDHEKQAKNRLISQFRGKQNIDSLISMFSKRYQNLENYFFDFYGVRLNLQETVGKQLDHVGELVGQSRLGYPDDFFRILIVSKIGINTSTGTIPNLIDIFKIATSIRQEVVTLTRRRVNIVGFNVRNAFRFSPREDDGKLIISIENDGDFFTDFDSGTVNGFSVTDSEDLLISGRNWRRIGLSGTPDYPPVGQNFVFRLSKIHPEANIQFFNLENGEVAFGTDGFFPDSLRDFLFGRLQGVVLAGTRLNYVCFYLPGPKSFAFSGGIGGGFGAGQLGTVTENKTPFAFGGISNGDLGFGTVYDPLTGGVLAN